MLGPRLKTKSAYADAINTASKKNALKWLLNNSVSSFVHFYHFKMFNFFRYVNTQLMTSLGITSIIKIANFVAYDNKKKTTKTVLYVSKLRSLGVCTFVQNKSDHAANY